ncbi:MAG: DivIVA domain-containing protein [Ilumatobacteraceae bacterium]
MSPQRVRSAEFKTARKGADPEQVRAFLNDVADELERAQNQSTAMEARARAAVARLQELSEGPTAEAPPPAPSMAAPDATDVPAEQSDAIGRTLVLAQRTADSLIAEARAEAARLVAAANSEAATTRDSTREMAATMLDEAREEARRLGETERLAVASEVDSLKARRDFLESDVDHLEQFLVAQRSRVRDAAAELIEITDRVPAGLGDSRRPLLSASDDAPADAAPSDNAGAAIAEPAEAGDDADGSAGFVDLDATQAIEVVSEIDDPADDGDATPVGSGLSDDDPSATDDGGTGFRFNFDDRNR